MPKNKLILIDGNSIANRAFYALPLLNNSEGLPTNAILGFTNMLLRLIEEEKPSHFLVAFDAGKETFRSKTYKDYKGHRLKTPPELSEQFPVLRELMDAFGISWYELAGYEADDIIGTAASRAEQEDCEVLIVSGDKDMLQLATEKTTIALTRKGISEVERYGPQEIDEKYGLTPSQIIDLKGLMGDSSDNIPGIPGIGEKTGLKLLHQYGSVEEVLKHTDELKGKMKERVIEHAEDAHLSKELATIFKEVPLEHSLADYKYATYEKDKLADIFRRLEFKQLLDKLDLPDATGEQAAEEDLNWLMVTADKVDVLKDKLPALKHLIVEVEGDNPHRGDLIGLALAGEDEAFYVPGDVLRSESELAKLLTEWLGNKDQEKLIYDMHKAEVALSWMEVQLSGVSFDVLLAAYLLDPTQTENHTLHGLMIQYGFPALQSDDEFYGKGAKYKLPGNDELGEFLCRKARAVCRLAPKLEEDLKAHEMYELLVDLEIPLANILAGMEKQGVKVDLEALKAYGQTLHTRIEETANRIYELAGAEFNLNSPKQLGEILFDKLGLPVIKKTKTGYSTNVEVLEKLEPYHEVIGKILDYRQLAKIQSTYVEGLIKEIRDDNQRVHTYFRQTIAATGRLSSQYPNLQNIPIRLEEGRQIRKLFIPSEPGWYILAADYSQIELRVMAHLSSDEGLKEAFSADMDIHTKTAMDVFGVEESEVDGEMRRQAKAVNFGIIYGISDYGLSQNLNITRKEAKQFIDQYFKAFGGVKTFMEETVEKAKEDGYVTTMLHRRRYLPQIQSSNFNQRSFAERTAMNTPIQGTAADIIKLAMVKMAESMNEKGLRSRMLLQVHDELVFEVPEDELKDMENLVREQMEDALALDVPLKVDVSYGKNWYETK